MPKTTNQEANRKIKMIASMAGINSPATENGVTAPKCNFVRTHTARRSAATNLAMQGVPLDFIAKLGGWLKLETLKKYLLASGLDVAMVASDYDFFK
jgi:site-specific recombinase XerD